MTGRVARFTRSAGRSTRPPGWQLLPLLLLIYSLPVRAQMAPVDDTPAAENASRPIVTDVRLLGNTAFPESTLRLNLRTHANRTFLGIPGLPFWRWLYDLGDGGCCLTGGVSRALKASGEPPAYLDPQLLATDAERLELFYQQEGFRSATVQPQVDTLRGGDRLRVTFRIDQGPPTFVRTLRYDGLGSLSADQRRRLVRASSLVAEEASPDSTLLFRPDGLRYSQSLFQEERRRLMSYLRDEGYAEVTRDSIRAFVTPVRPDSFDVTFRIQTGRRLRFGGVHFVVNGPEDAPQRVDTLVADASSLDADTVRTPIVATIVNERRLRPSALTRAMRFEPGEWFSQTQLLNTKRRLEATGLFSFSDFIPRWAEMQRTSAGIEGVYLPYTIELRTRERHQIRWEFVMLSRDAVLGDESGSDEVGVGLGMSYRNANLFGTGEGFQIRTSGSIAAAIRGSAFSTAQAEVEASVLYPYLLGPLRRLDRALNLIDARTRVALRLLTARREELRLLIRGRAAVQVGVEMRHTPTLTSVVNLLDFNLSDPDTLGGFSDRFLGFVDDPVERERILEDYSRPQVNNALRYTLRSSTADLLRRDRGYIREASFEVGGNLPYVLDRLVFTPDVVEGSIPGLPFFRRDNAEASRLIYRQYVRFLADLRRYKAVSPRTVLAWKAIGGWAHPIGRAPVVPFDRRFYSGGASSVRGWGFRALGPGGLTGRTSEAIIQGGDVKLEASAETRSVFLRNAFAANWMMALFVDAGNVWYGPRNPGNPDGRFQLRNFLGQVGIGSGLGLRIAWEYLIVRFDLAYKVHDPVQGFFPDGLRSPRLHFGIGQAF